MHSEKIYLYIGPTAYNLPLDQLIPQYTEVLPPVRRGDIQHLIGLASPATIVIVDGTYHTFPAVSHVEIKNALTAGWQVWGLSSMGAIRAAEMHELGMKGYGMVYQRFIDDEDLPDDYVALVHSTESPWFPVSEPLIHFECLLNEALRQSVITRKVHNILMHNLQNMWFGDRTITYLRKKSHELMNGGNQSFCAMLSRMEDFRLKTWDVVDFFHEQPFSNIRSQHGNQIN